MQDQKYVGFVFSASKVDRELIVRAFLFAQLLRADVRVWAWGYDAGMELTFRYKLGADCLPLNQEERHDTFSEDKKLRVKRHFTIAFSTPGLEPMQLCVLENELCKHWGVTMLTFPSDAEWEMALPVSIPRFAIARWVHYGKPIDTETKAIKSSRIGASICKVAKGVN